MNTKVFIPQHLTLNFYVEYHYFEHTKTHGAIYHNSINTIEEILCLLNQQKKITVFKVWRNIYLYYN